MREKKERILRWATMGGTDGVGDPLRGKSTCTPALLRFMKEIFEMAGFSVSLNSPYAGGFIVTHYGSALAAGGKMALQIEINQNLYMEPETEEIISEKVRDVRSGIFECFKKIGEGI